MPKFNFNYTAFVQHQGTSVFAREAMVSSSPSALAHAALTHGYSDGSVIAILPTRFSEPGTVVGERITAYTPSGGAIAEAAYDADLLAASRGICLLYHISEQGRSREYTTALTQPISFHTSQELAERPVSTKRLINIRRK